MLVNSKSFPTKDVLANFHGLALADGKFVIDNDDTASLLVLDYGKTDKVEQGMVATISEDDPITQSGSIWYSAKNGADGFVQKDNLGRSSSGNTLDDVRNYNSAAAESSSVITTLFNKKGPDKVINTNAGAVRSDVRTLTKNEYDKIKN